MTQWRWCSRSGRPCRTRTERKQSSIVSRGRREGSMKALPSWWARTLTGGGGNRRCGAAPRPLGGPLARYRRSGFPVRHRFRHEVSRRVAWFSPQDGKQRFELNSACPVRLRPGTEAKQQLGQRHVGWRRPRAEARGRSEAGSRHRRLAGVADAGRPGASPAGQGPGAKFGCRQPARGCPASGGALLLDPLALASSMRQLPTSSRSIPGTWNRR